MDPDVFPASLRGFMIAAFAAAYMSTIGTQLNWGASYVINDFYRRFVVRDASERHYVIASQIVTVLLMVLSLVVTFYLDSIEYAWKLLMVTGAGTGTVLLAAVVLVADQRLVGSVGDGRGRGRVAVSATPLRLGKRQLNRSTLPI